MSLQSLLACTMLELKKLKKKTKDSRDFIVSTLWLLQLNMPRKTPWFAQACDCLKKILPRCAPIARRTQSKIEVREVNSDMPSKYRTNAGK